VASFLPNKNQCSRYRRTRLFSSLSESGFIPTYSRTTRRIGHWPNVLISFREWLHSYIVRTIALSVARDPGSHLFQRVASFLLKTCRALNQLYGRRSHLFQRVASFLLGPFYHVGRLPSNRFSSLSESGFIPTSRISKR